MVNEYKESSDFYKTALAAVFLCLAFVVACVAALFFVPESKAPSYMSGLALIEAPQTEDERKYTEEVSARAQDIAWLNKEAFNTLMLDGVEGKASETDKGLELYRNPATRAAVEWFYLRVTGNRDVTMAILDAANREDIPLTLAFALCYTESRFNRYARGVNTNGSIDRGLFQLNDRSFPRLASEDFYVPETSASYGMKHLRFCMNVAGNDLTALAMYNAGVSRVRNDQTPTSTLRYVGRVVSYRSHLENSFTEEVLIPFAEQNQNPMIVPAGK